MVAPSTWSRVIAFFRNGTQHGADPDSFPPVQDRSNHLVGWLCCHLLRPLPSPARRVYNNERSKHEPTHSRSSSHTAVRHAGYREHTPIPISPTNHRQHHQPRLQHSLHTTAHYNCRICTRKARCVHEQSTSTVAATEASLGPWLVGRVARATGDAKDGIGRSTPCVDVASRLVVWTKCIGTTLHFSHIWRGGDIRKSTGQVLST
jgi:hypothetical protein